jgi:hypothetical protein
MLRKVYSDGGLWMTEAVENDSLESGLKQPLLITSEDNQQEVAQSAGTTPNEAEVISSNSPPPSCADMSKKKKKTINKMKMMSKNVMKVKKLVRILTEQLLQLDQHIDYLHLL